MSTVLPFASRHDHPAVSGKPLRWLQAEGAVEFGAALLLFETTDQSWWLTPLILVPDLFMLGYASGTKVGAAFYNLAHNQAAPVLLCLAALQWHRPLLLALALLWIAHIGLDRALSFGLKYDTNFGHTHLGDQSARQIGRTPPG